MLHFCCINYWFHSWSIEYNTNWLLFEGQIMFISTVQKLILNMYKTFPSQPRKFWASHFIHRSALSVSRHSFRGVNESMKSPWKKKKEKIKNVHLQRLAFLFADKNKQYEKMSCCLHGECLLPDYTFQQMMYSESLGNQFQVCTSAVIVSCHT